MLVQPGERIALFRRNAQAQDDIVRSQGALHERHQRVEPLPGHCRCHGSGRLARALGKPCLPGNVGALIGVEPVGLVPGLNHRLAGFGDVIVTCFSQHSRNRYVGEQIGKGRSLEEVEAEMTMVAEGVRTTLSVHDLAKRHGIELPITEGVYRVLFEGYPPQEGVEELMSREPKRENWLPEMLRE